MMERNGRGGKEAGGFGSFKMIDREKNGMERLLHELKKGIKAEVDESRRGADTNSENNEGSRDDDEDCTTYHGRIPLVL